MQITIHLFPVVSPSAIVFSNFIRDNAVDASRPEVGSSRIKILGSSINRIPIDTRLFSPPLIPLTSALPIGVFAQFFRPNSSRIRSARSSRCFNLYLSDNRNLAA